MTERDYIDKLTHSESEEPRETAAVNAMGVPILNVMVVPSRAVSSEEIEDREREQLSTVQLPIPFWDETGALEPLNMWDYDLLKRAGVTPEEWEILVLEDHLERKPQ